MVREPGRVGRPPGVDGDETRHQIIGAARACFSALGYTATTNRMIADRAGLTSAAVYHHFGRKSNLMVSVFRATEELYQERIKERIEAAGNLSEKIAALIDVIHETVRDDPEQVIFFSVARDEARRHEELSEIAADLTFATLLADLAAYGVEHGEIAPTDLAAARGAISAVATGLAMLARDMSVEAHRVAAEGCKRMLSGQLLVQPANA